ncbi:MAG TPA: VWA domain-containing protein [Candidatus Binatia bacterium]|nr:VWA domain-containing protein [Candidatus Binatia bacterium]
MKLLFDFEFARPYLLWLLLVLPLVWFRVRDRHWLVLIARTVILALIVFTLADPQAISEQTRNQERIFAYDVSKSVPLSMRQWMKNPRNGFPSPSRSDRVFVFGSRAMEAPNWRDLLEAEPEKLASAEPEKTNLENLFNALLALPAAPRSLYLYTDGWETLGNVERLLPALAAAGIKVNPILPPERPAIANVALTKLLAPSQGNSGESFNLKVVVENQNERPVEGTLSITRNGQPLKTEGVKLRPGSQTFSYQVTPGEGELTAYEASFKPRDPNSDRYLADNRALAWVSTRSKAKVLLINGRSGAGPYLEEILRRQGLEVTVTSPGNAPAPNGYKVIIFNNAERERFSSNYLAAVERHVAEGNGFLMLGADASFAPESYHQTPVEKLMPVEPKEPPKPEEKNRAVVLVIDKSGSMREEGRMVYAKEAAKAVARQLKDNDLLGVVGFDDSPFVVTYLETMSRLRGLINAQIDRLKPGGQTYFLPALLEAKRQLERVNASRKHLILLSDGETRGSQGELVDLVNSMRATSKITVSAIAISGDADVRIMKRIAQYGGGLFHHVIDPSTLPQIVLEQLQDKPRDERQNDTPWIPYQERSSELLAGFSQRSYPPLLGVMETELKRGAQQDLVAQKQDRRLPLLASWRYGRGRSVALATDLEGRWSRNWIQWGGLQGFWGRILEWLSPPQENLVPAHEARVSFADTRSILDLSVYEDVAAYSQYRYMITGKALRAQGTLEMLAPGHYQTALPLSEPGDYRIDLVEERSGRKIPFPPIGYTLAYQKSAEVSRPEFNTRLLAQLAQVTGGEINPRFASGENTQIVSKTYRSLRQPLIILVFCFFLFEVAFRKLIVAEAD